MARTAINARLRKIWIGKSGRELESEYRGKPRCARQNGTANRTAINYSFGRPLNSQDLRLTKTFTFSERYKFSILGEGFNMFNYR